MTRTATPGLPLPLVRRGKVREVYQFDADHLLLVASDRISAFDVIMREPIPGKGIVLTQLSAWWFQQLGEVTPTPSDQITEVVAKARLAAKLWRNLDIDERVDLLNQAFAQLESQEEELAILLSREMGKDFRRASGEVPYR